MRSEKKTGSFRLRMVTVTVLFIVMSIILSVSVTSIVFSREMSRRNEQQTLSAFLDAQNRLLKMLSRVFITANSIYTSDGIQDCIEQVFQSAEESAYTRMTFSNQVMNAVNSSIDIGAVFFFDESGRMAGVSQGQFLHTTNNEYPFYETIRDINDHGLQGIVWLDNIGITDIAQALEHRSNQSGRRLVCGLRQYSYYNQDMAGIRSLVMLFEVEQTALWNCISHLTEDGSRVYLMNQEGIIIAGSDRVGTVPDFFTAELPQRGSVMYTDAERVKYQVITYPLPVSGWSFVKCTPQLVLLHSVRALWQSAAIVGVITICITSMLYAIWAGHFSHPILQLADSMNDAGGGNLNAQVEVKDSYPKELQVVCRQYNSMLSDLKDYLVQKEIDERERMDLEIKTLQAQITPHFIYNTVTSIRWMAAASGAENVADALIVFSQIIHPVFSSWQQSWTLREEYEFLSNYIRLMRMRFGNRISIRSELEPDASGCRIPRFALQTLMENCCEHGFDTDRILHIELRSEIRDGILFTHIRDDGKGMTRERLEEIYRSLENEGAEKNIGLVNLNRRIKLFFGEDCGMDIVSEVDKGTEITVRMHALY